jgi:hypothetical protein
MSLTPGFHQTGQQQRAGLYLQQKSKEKWTIFPESTPTLYKGYLHTTWLCWAFNASKKKKDCVFSN